MTTRLESNRCWAIAHRGSPQRQPENTIAGFDQALEMGCDGIEFDVQLSRDDRPVIYHDRTLTRAGGGRKRVHQLDLVELSRLDPATGWKGATGAHSIPTLAQLLDRYAGRTRLLVEIKTREGAAATERHERLATLVARAVQERVPAGSAWILSFDADVLATVAQVAPELPRVLNVRPLLPGLDGKVQRADPAVVSADVRGLSPAFGDGVRRAGRELWSFTCNSPGSVRRARNAGVTAIISDRVDWLTEQLRRA